MIDSNDNADVLFLQALFGNELGQVQVCSFPEDPQNIPSDRRGLAWYTHLWQNHRAFEPYTNRFFCISLFNMGADDITGQPKVQRRRKLHRKTCVIALDDVVEKLDPLIVALLPRPTAILETSPGSHQWFYRVSQADWALYSCDQVENLQDGLVASDLCPSGVDPGLKNVTRLVRLPSGWNTKARNVTPWMPEGVKCQLLELNPEVEVTLEQIALPLNIDINAARRQTSVNMGTEDANHPVLQVLDVLNAKGGGCYDVACPFADDPDHGHSNPSDTSGTTIQVFSDGNANIDCRHGHSDQVNGRKKLMGWCSTQPGWDEAVASYSATTSEFSQPDSAAAFAGYQGVGSSPTVEIDGVTFVAEDKEYLDADLANALDSIRHSVLVFYGGDPGGPAQCGLDTQPLVKAWNEMFYSAEKKMAYMFNGDGRVVKTPDTKVVQYIENLHGTVISLPALIALVAGGARVDSNGRTLTDGDPKKLRTDIFKTFTIALEIARQRTSISYEVDMFTAEPHMKLEPGFVSVTQVHEPFKVDMRPTDNIVLAVLADYEQHFPSYREFIRAIAAARFAGNARKAYSWLHATSSWGKTFLLNGVLGGELGIVSGLTVKEIAKIMNGDPVGKSQEDFINAWILFIDEVRYLSGDIKQLDREITGSPKHQLSFKTKVHSKIFCSAFSMDSVAGDSGVESQFVSRFSYIRPTLNARLEDRELFIQLGATVYRKALAAWTADFLNMFVGEMRCMGNNVQEARIMAANHCDKILDVYHDANNIGDHLGTLSETLEGFAEELKQVAVRASVFENRALAFTGLPQSVVDIWSADRLVRGFHDKHGEVVVIKSPTKLIKAWLVEQVSKSEMGGLTASAHDVLTMMDVEGRGARMVRLHHAGGVGSLDKGIIVSVK